MFIFLFFLQTPQAFVGVGMGVGVPLPLTGGFGVLPQENVET